MDNTDTTPTATEILQALPLAATDQDLVYTLIVQTDNYVPDVYSFKNLTTAIDALLEYRDLIEDVEVLDTSTDGDDDSVIVTCRMVEIGWFAHVARTTAKSTVGSAVRANRWTSAW